MKLDLLISKYYEMLTLRQYTYQNELKNPSAYEVVNEDSISQRQQLHCEIELIKQLINELEDLKEYINEFSF